MAQDLRKLARKKELPPIYIKPDDPAALYRSHDEQVAHNKKQKEARKVAEQAFRKAMEEDVEEVNLDLVRAENKLVQQKQLLKTLIANNDEYEQDLEDAEAGGKKSIKMKIGRNNKKIAVTESTIEDLEKEIEELS